MISFSSGSARPPACCMPRINSAGKSPIRRDSASSSSFQDIWCLPNLKRHADSGDRFRMTVLREPLEQLVSHIAWIRFQTESEQSRAFRSLPDNVKRLAERLVALFAGQRRSARELSWHRWSLPIWPFSIIVRRATLLPQVKGSVAPGMLRRARRDLEGMDFVGLSEYMPDVFDYLSFRFGWSRPRVTCA